MATNAQGDATPRPARPDAILIDAETVHNWTNYQAESVAGASHLYE